MAAGQCPCPSYPSLQGDLPQPWLGKSLALGFIMLPSVMLGMALRGFLIRGTPQITCSASPSPKKGDGE